MQNKYWFESKKYGFGFVPVSLEGWLAVLILFILILIIMQTNGLFTGKVTGEDSLRIVFDVFVVVGIFSVTLRGKVRDGLKWRWGMPKKSSPRRR